jgi:uncharacterized membrane protein YdjX (TVP38/TMEM64 family)
MTLIESLLITYSVVFLANLAPAFMPPTWSILAFFLVRYDLPLIPLAVGGAVAASTGRLCLALVSRRWGRRWVSAERRANLSALGRWLDTRGRWTAPLAMLVYSFGPIPSNQLFMAAGLTGMRLRLIMGAFLVGRLFSYTFFTASVQMLYGKLEEVFTEHLGNTSILLLEMVALGALVLLTRMNWLKVLPQSAVRDTGTASATQDPDRQSP